MAKSLSIRITNLFTLDLRELFSQAMGMSNSLVSNRSLNSILTKASPI